MIKTITTIHAVMIDGNKNIPGTLWFIGNELYFKNIHGEKQLYIPEWYRKSWKTESKDIRKFLFLKKRIVYFLVQHKGILYRFESNSPSEAELNGYLRNIVNRARIYEEDEQRRQREDLLMRRGEEKEGYNNEKMALVPQSESEQKTGQKEYQQECKEHSIDEYHKQECIDSFLEEENDQEKQELEYVLDSNEGHKGTFLDNAAKVSIINGNCFDNEPEIDTCPKQESVDLYLVEENEQEKQKLEYAPDSNKGHKEFSLENKTIVSIINRNCFDNEPEIDAELIESNTNYKNLKEVINNAIESGMDIAGQYISLRILYFFEVFVHYKESNKLFNEDYYYEMMAALGEVSLPKGLTQPLELVVEYACYYCQFETTLLEHILEHIIYHIHYKKCSFYENIETEDFRFSLKRLTYAEEKTHDGIKDELDEARDLVNYTRFVEQKNEQIANGMEKRIQLERKICSFLKQNRRPVTKERLNKEFPEVPYYILQATLKRAEILD